MESIEIQNHSRDRMWDSEKDHRSLFAAESANSLSLVTKSGRALQGIV